MEGMLIILKGDYPELAEAEAKALFYGWGFWNRKEKVDCNTLFFPNKRKISTIAGLIHRLINVKYVLRKKNFLKELSRKKWKMNGSYRVRLFKLCEHVLHEREVAKVLYEIIDNPSVNLRNPDNTVDVVITEEWVYVGLRVWEDNQKWKDRRADKWPAPHPTAMPPHVARALMNISCSEKVHDPFCGAGGFLIEGGLAGKKVSGSDILPEMITRAKKNTKQYGLAPELKVADAIEWLPRTKAIVTDPPYGRNTKKVDMDPLLEAFFEKARGKTHRLIICANKPLKPLGWCVRFNTSSYVHKLMTRHYYVLEAK